MLSDIGGASSTSDVTGITITSDSGTASDTSGNLDITVSGGEGIDTSATGSTLTIAGEEASTSNKGVASFHTDNFAVSSGQVTIKSGGVDLTDEVTGTLPVGNGGIGATSLTGMLFGNGGSAFDAWGLASHSGNTLTIDSSAADTGSILFINDDSYSRSTHIDLDIEDTLTTTTARAGKGLINISCTRPSSSPVSLAQNLEAIGFSTFMKDECTSGSPNIGGYTMIGNSINCTFTDPGGITETIGLEIQCGGADNNYDIKMINQHDSSEYGTIEVGGGGALQISTVSDDTTGHLTLDIDGDIELNADGGDITFKDDTVTLATIDAIGSAIANGGQITTNRKFIKTNNTDGLFEGDVVYFGSETGMTAGKIYYYKNATAWELTDADTETKSTGLLAVALGSESNTHGMLIRGMVTLDHDPGTIGNTLFLSTTAGECTSTHPTGNADIVRVVGYCLDSSNGQIWFDPSKSWVKVSA